jgi:catechol 2,3-dioxygenase-like lactoylglutathione lyase family enzyme
MTPVPLGHVGITVPDVEAAASWYAEAFGWRVLMGPVEVTTEDPRVAGQLREVFERDEVAFRQVHMEMADGVALELFEFRTPPTVPAEGFEFAPVGPFHICVVDPEIEALVARIERLGGRRRTPIQPIFPGEPYRFCYCEDPFGIAIEVATHPHTQSFSGREAY